MIMKKMNTTVSNPAVGMGATIQHFTDQTPVTIVQVSPTGKKLVLQEDKAIRQDNNGMSEAQVYTYEQDSSGDLHVATLRKDGRYRIKGCKELVSIGRRVRYFDYSF
jgi:hypothetical protein